MAKSLLLFWFYIFRSIIEPIRHSLHGQEKNYHCAKAISLDTNKQMLKCTNILHPEQGEYDLHYDKLVIGVGATSNTFNVPGVKEYAFFLKVRIFLQIILIILIM